MIRMTLARAVVLLAVISCIPAYAAKPPTLEEICQDPSKASKKTVVFDHLAGHILTTTPAVLELRDGQVFQVVFCNTRPSDFDYEITPIEADKVDTTNFKDPTDRAMVDKDSLGPFPMDRQHKDVFSLYKVTVRVRSDSENTPVVSKKDVIDRIIARMGVTTPMSTAQLEALEEEPMAELYDKYLGTVPPEDLPKPVYLYSYSFPVWVKNVGWNLSFSTGVAFSNLTNRKFYIETDTQDTEETGDDTKTVQEDTHANGASRPDLVVFANLRTPDGGWWTETHDRRQFAGRLGLAFGLGLNGDGDPRYFVGPSWTIGRKNHFVLIGGWTGGMVDRLPLGQRVGEAPLTDNVLNNLDSSFEHGFFAGLTFSFNSGDSKKADLLKALTGKATQTDKGAPAKNE